jgi:hypothetical protein
MTSDVYGHLWKKLVFPDLHLFFSGGFLLPFVAMREQ